MYTSRYRKLQVARSSALPDGGQELAGPDPQQAPLRVTADHYRIAQMFDGRSSGDAICARVEAEFGTRPSRRALEAFAAQLAVTGVLLAGYAEPLPSVTLLEPQLDTRVDPADSGPLLPSTAPGSLTGPGLMDGLLEIVTDARREQKPPLLQLQPRPWVACGRLLNWPLHSPLTALLFVALLLALVFGLQQHYLRGAVSLLLLRNPLHLLILLPLAWVVLQSFSAAARAAAVADFAGVAPAIELRLNELHIPHLRVDTSGPVERAPLAQRLRIIGSGLSAMGALMGAGIFCWFLSHSTHPLISAYSLACAVVGAGFLLFRLNPLVRRDGYFLLAQWVGIADLREQAGAAWFNYLRRGWVAQKRVLPKNVLRLYWVLVGLYFAVLIYFWSLSLRLFLRHYGGAGFVLLVVMGVIVSQTFKTTREGSNLDLGAVKRKPWYKRRAAWLALAAIVAAVPYRYDPSGDFLVLPGARADVRALISGDVREVLVKEGQAVQAGEVLARLSDDEERAAVASAKAKLAKLNSDLALAGKGGKAEEVSVAESAVETARKRAEVSAEQAARLAAAYKRNSVTAQEYERMRGQADIDKRSLEEARSRLNLVRSAAASDVIASIKAQVGEAQAALDYAQTQLEYTQIKAPIAGRVVSGSLQFALGAYLNRGDQLATIESTEQRLAEVKLPEAGIDQVQVGKSAWAKVWAFPSSSFGGKVLSIAPNAEDGPYGKVVRVQVELQDPDHRLLPGMTGNAKLQGHWYPAVVVFTRALVRFFLVEVWSWIP